MKESHQILLSFLTPNLVMTWGSGHGRRCWRVSVPPGYKIPSHLGCSRGGRTEYTTHRQQSPGSALQHKIRAKSLFYQRKKPLSSKRGGIFQPVQTSNTNARAKSCSVKHLLVFRDLLTAPRQLLRSGNIKDKTPFSQSQARFLPTDKSGHSNGSALKLQLFF